MSEIPVLKLGPVEDAPPKPVTTGLTEPWYVCYAGSEGHTQVYDCCVNELTAMQAAVELPEEDYPGVHIVYVDIQLEY